MKTRSFHRFFSLFLTMTACGGAPDGVGAPAESAGKTQETLLARGTFTTATIANGATASPLRSNLAGSAVAPLATVSNPGTAPPVDADLRPDGAMRFYGVDPNQPTEGLQVDVVNIGTDPAYGPASHLSINGYSFSTALYQYYGGTATALNTLNPGERGYLQAEIPTAFVLACSQYTVQIDLDHTMQSGPNVFANDTRTVLAYETGVVCPLAWTTPINTATVGTTLDVHEDGKSLQDIVSSVEIGRLDGHRCSDCHNNLHLYPYQPEVAPGAVSVPPIDPFQPSGGYVEGPVNWACGGNPWSQQFIAQPDSVKPPYLKAALQKWLNDGTLP
jgi:hypothetical protein